MTSFVLVIRASRFGHVTDLNETNKPQRTTHLMPLGESAKEVMDLAFLGSHLPDQVAQGASTKRRVRGEVADCEPFVSKGQRQRVQVNGLVSDAGCWYFLQHM